MERAPKVVPMKIAEATQKKRMKDKKKKSEKIPLINTSSNKAALRQGAADSQP